MLYCWLLKITVATFNYLNSPLLQENNQLIKTENQNL